MLTRQTDIEFTTWRVFFYFKSGERNLWGPNLSFFFFLVSIRLVLFLCFVIRHGDDGQNQINKVERSQKYHNDEVKTMVRTLCSQRLAEEKTSTLFYLSDDMFKSYLWTEKHYFCSSDNQCGKCYFHKTYNPNQKFKKENLAGITIIDKKIRNKNIDCVFKLTIW